MPQPTNQSGRADVRSGPPAPDWLFLRHEFPALFSKLNLYIGSNRTPHNQNPFSSSNFRIPCNDPEFVGCREISGPAQ